MAGKGKQKAELQVEIKSQEQWDNLMEKPGLLVVDAYSAWCGPCRAVVSLFRRIKNELGDDFLNFAIAETDVIESLKYYRGKSRPAFLFYGGGKLVYAIRGCRGPQLEKSIRSLLEKEHKIMDGSAERVVFIDPEIKATSYEKIATPQLEITREEEDEEEIVEVPKEVTVAVIKPDAVREGKVESILQRLAEAGIEVVHQEERVLTKEEAADFYKHQEGSEHFEQLIEFMSSGPCVTLVLSKAGDSPGHGVIPEFRNLLGPKDVNVAKEEAPTSLRAEFGTDQLQNALHGCDSHESAARELAFFFPNFNAPKVLEKKKKKELQRTLALIRPSALKKRRGSIINKIEGAGFVIAMSKEMHLSREQVEDFYSDHKDQPYFENLVESMTCGPSLALCLAREDAVEVWRNMLGPKEVDVAKNEAPESMRAVFAEDGDDINPIHGADSVTNADQEINKLFPKESTIAVIKPEAYSEPDQRELVMGKIKEAGFDISAQKEVVLTKELAGQFYHEHNGKEFFDSLTDYMSSGPTLFLVLSREDAVDGFRELMGPNDPLLAKEQFPSSLRAQLATDQMKNAIHGSSTKEQARKVIADFFPELEVQKDGSVEGDSENPEGESTDKETAEEESKEDAEDGESKTADEKVGDAAPSENAEEHESVNGEDHIEQSATHDMEETQEEGDHVNATNEQVVGDENTGKDEKADNTTQENVESGDKVEESGEGSQNVDSETNQGSVPEGEVASDNNNNEGEESIYKPQEVADAQDDNNNQENAT